MRILIVSYYFTPYNTIGAIRVGKLAKYLMHQGHEVKVLTAKDQPLPLHLPVEIDERNVIRTHWININWLPEKIVGGRELVAKEGFSRKGRWRGILNRAGLLYKSVSNFPDGQIGWYLPALRAGRQLFKTWKPDIIYASARPFTSLMVARGLSAQGDVPWVAELRDLWVDSHNYEYGFLRKLLESRLEKHVLSSAKGIVTVSTPLAQKLRKKYSQPIAVILNGYDADDYADIRRRGEKKSELVEIVYTGSFYEGKYDLAPLFAALGRTDPVKRRRIRIYFYGRYLEPVRAAARKYNVGSIVKIQPTIPYSDSLKKQMKADALLLFLWNNPEEKGVYTGKLFEYIGAKRPILAVGPKDNVAADLIREHRLGAVVSTANETREALDAILEKKKPFDIPSLERNGNSEFTREYQYSKLIRFIEDIMKERL